MLNEKLVIVPPGHLTLYLTFMHVFEELTLFLVSKVTSSKPQRIAVNACVNRMCGNYSLFGIDTHVRASKNLFRESKIGPLFKLNWREEEITCGSGILTSLK